MECLAQVFFFFHFETLVFYFFFEAITFSDHFVPLFVGFNREHDANLFVLSSPKFRLAIFDCESFVPMRTIFSEIS